MGERGIQGEAGGYKGVRGIHRVSYRIFCWGGRSNCKGSASVRKHGHTRVSVRAT